VDRRIDNRIHSARQNRAEYFPTAIDTGHEVTLRVNWICAKNQGATSKRQRVTENPQWPKITVL
jgi:hypothetical protein